jgi:HD-GYP domain-containing protein (c-di-GMP phosphodiesterase class II)
MLGVKYHHERYDGSGYPEGLKGKQIPLIAAVIAVADAFDAMTTNRPYRRGLTKDEAIQEITRTRGQQFDPEVVTAFLVLCEEGKI